MTLELTLTLILALLFSTGRAHAQANTFLDATVGPQPTTGFRVSVATAPITASFTFSPSSGAWPLTVQFVDTTQGGPASWAWDFGDGFSDTSQNPVHTYYYPGTFIVTMITTGAGGTTSTSGIVIATNPACPPLMTATVNQQVSITGNIRSQGLVFGNSSLFACTRSTPSSIIQWTNLNNLAVYKSVALPSDGLHDRCQDMIYDATSGLLLATFQHSGSSLLSSIDPAALTVTDVVNDSNSQLSCSVCSDGTFAYVTASDIVDGTLVLSRYAMSNWTAQGRVKITNAIAPGVIRYDGTNLYGDCSTLSAGVVYRVNLPSMTYQTNTLPLPFTILSDDMGVYGQYLYCGSENPTVPQGAIVQVKKDDLTATVLTNCIAGGASFGTYFDDPNVGNSYQGLVWDAVSLTQSSLVGMDPITHQMWQANLGPAFNSLNEIVSDGVQLFTTTYQDPPTISRIGITRNPVPLDIVFPAGTLVAANSSIATHIRWNGAKYGAFLLRPGSGPSPMSLFVYDAFGNTNRYVLTGTTYNQVGSHIDFDFSGDVLVVAGAPANTAFTNCAVYEYLLTPSSTFPIGLTLVTNFNVGNTNCINGVVTALSDGGFAVGFSEIRSNVLNVTYRYPSGNWTNLGHIPLSNGGNAAPFIAAAQMGGTSNWWTLENWDGSGILYATEWSTSNGLNKIRDFLLCNNETAGSLTNRCWGLQAPYGETVPIEMVSDTVSNRILVTYSNDHFGPATTLGLPSIYTVLCGLQSGVSAFNPALCGSVDTNNFYLITESDTATLIDFGVFGVAQSGNRFMLSRIEWTDAAFANAIYPFDIQIGTQSPFSPSSRIRSSANYSLLGFAEHRYDVLYQDFNDNKWHLLIGL